MTRKLCGSILVRLMVCKFVFRSVSVIEAGAPFSLLRYTTSAQHLRYPYHRLIHRLYNLCAVYPPLIHSLSPLIPFIPHLCRTYTQIARALPTPIHPYTPLSTPIQFMHPEMWVPGSFPCRTCRHGSGTVVSLSVQRFPNVPTGPSHCSQRQTRRRATYGVNCPWGSWSPLGDRRCSGTDAAEGP